MPLDLQVARDLGSATLHEAAGRIGSLPSAIQAVTPGMRVAGPALPVRTASGDNLWLHRAIYAAGPGDVLVVASGDDDPRFGYWGEIMSEAATARDLGGLVLQGGSRDTDRLAEIGFPVFSLGRCIRGTVKDPADDGTLGEVVHLGDVDVHAGDLVVGDADGVVVIPSARAAEVIELGLARVDKEATVIEQLRHGASTVELYQLGGPS
jgi:4-hydroxy-4-methyl-2-oxoglutarate aldolase